MRTIRQFSHTLVFICILHVTILSHGIAPATESSLLIEDLRYTITTLAKARNSIVLRHQKSATKDFQLSAEQQDLLVFVSYLDGRIYYYCQQLFDSGGTRALSETVCPTSQDGVLETTQYSSIPATPSQTSEEKLTDLDSSFSESLGTFDEMLLKEQQKVASHTPRQHEDGVGTDAGLYETVNSASTQGGNGETNSDNGYSETTGSSSDRNGSRDQSSAPETSSNQGTGTGSARQSKSPPTSGNRDLSQSDDDIIAKQLKEAAEQETDPEVKAKLWEEYRKYKDGIR